MIKKTHSSRFSTFSMLVLLGALCLLLTACGCDHEWKSATCEEPKTCKLCGETEGEALEHDWDDATCEEPKTCDECGKTKGEPLGHTWVDATCDTPKTCSVCEATEGDVLPHAWLDATTDAPKTCSACQATEGERIITDSRFTTAACKDLFGSWKSTFEFDGEMMGDPDFTGVMKVLVELDFSNDGNLAITYTLADKEGFQAEYTAFIEDALYTALAAEGLSKDEADVAMKSTYGMTTPQYAEYTTNMVIVGWEAQWKAASSTGNYYVEDGAIYIADSWDETFEPDEYELVDGVLSIASFTDLFDDMTFEKEILYGSEN